MFTRRRFIGSGVASTLAMRAYAAPPRERPRRRGAGHRRLDLARRHLAYAGLVPRRQIRYLGALGRAGGS